MNILIFYRWWFWSTILELRIDKDKKIYIITHIKIFPFVYISQKTIMKNTGSSSSDEWPHWSIHIHLLSISHGNKISFGLAPMIFVIYCFWFY